MMTACKYWDCGFCYAPKDVLTTAQPSGACAAPSFCFYLMSQRTDLKFTSPSGETTLKFEDTGRIGTVAPKTQLHIKKMDEPVKYEKPMTAVEDIEAQIKVLQSKLEFYKELENHKTPCEEAFNRVYKYYPNHNMSNTTWIAFVNGYKSAQEDYKVEEFQVPAKDESSLYERFVNEGAYGMTSFENALRVVNDFLMDEGIIEDESGEYITFTLPKSLLEVPND